MAVHEKVKCEPNETLWGPEWELTCFTCVSVGMNLGFCGHVSLLKRVIQTLRLESGVMGVGEAGVN